MDFASLEIVLRPQLDEMLGYLNFSSGAPDAKFQFNCNHVCLRTGFAEANAGTADGEIGGTPHWGLVLARLLENRLAELHRSSPAFADIDQASQVIPLALLRLPEAYRRFHRDLLFHVTDAELFTPYLLARLCETVLRVGGPFEESERVLSAAIEELNDFIGFRPVASLRPPQKVEPYAHEWVRPTPLYIAGAGTACGRYADLIARTVQLVRAVPDEILTQAHFDPDLLDELSLDPRAYDFDHPVNKRPSYNFGQWDPHSIDSKGRYRRFVLVQLTLDAMLERVTQGGATLPLAELLEEAAIVLVGTMLMASGVSGGGPDTHDSTVTLATLLPKVAGLRDQFYDSQLAAIAGRHGDRLREEAVSKKQPFGGARQDLNQRLARIRAAQLERRHLAVLFAQIGAADASQRQLSRVPTASARMTSELECRLAIAHLRIDRGELHAAAMEVPAIDDVLHRAIECGALIDPWNILGMGGQFSVFTAIENTVHDHRADDLLDMIEQILAVHSRLLSEAAAYGAQDLLVSLPEQMDRFAQWWDRFATTAVSGLKSLSAAEAVQSATEVAHGLAAWREAGVAAGDVRFWREKVHHFRAPRAYALVVESLLERRDYVAAMALLFQWLSQVGEIPLEEGEYSFHDLALRWLQLVHSDPQPPPVIATGGDRWKLTIKFFDYLQANADEYWQAPTFEFRGEGKPGRTAGNRDQDEDEAFDTENAEPLDDESDEGDENPYAAAYEEVTYRDSTADGVDASLFDSGPSETLFELDIEGERIGRRLEFLSTVARLWREAALASVMDPPQSLAAADLAARRESLESWHAQVVEVLRRLRRLLNDVDAFAVPPPSSGRDALLEYERRRGAKVALLERIIATTVDMSTAARYLLAASGATPSNDLPEWEQRLAIVLRAMFCGDAAAVREEFPTLLKALSAVPLLYVPPSIGGRIQHTVQARIGQRVFRRLLERLPRLGLLRETGELLRVAQKAESYHGLGDGAVTEFDRLFQYGYAAVVESLVLSSETWAEQLEDRDSQLFEMLQQVTQKLLRSWLVHSRSVRISAIEAISNKPRWQNLVEFVQKYGADLFTPRFFNGGNLRAIRHQGVDAYLRRLQEHPDPDCDYRLLEDLDRTLDREETVENLNVILDTLLENQVEYQDFQATTTQSDRGEMLYTLLDFLRVKAGYNRLAHSLKPAIVAHDILVRRQRTAAAALWRHEVARQTSDTAAQHVRRVEALSKKYGMRLATVTDRVQERFVRPLELDRIRGMVKPAVLEIRQSHPAQAIEQLEQAIEEFARTPTGSGMSVPDWIIALEDEVDETSARTRLFPGLQEDPRADVPRRLLGPQDVRDELAAWD